MERELEVIIERDSAGYYVASVPALRVSTPSGPVSPTAFVLNFGWFTENTAHEKPSFQWSRPSRPGRSCSSGGW